MDIGFETIGNAVLICYDSGPVLVTDPWITGDAYFGSWMFSHEIPAEQREAIQRCSYVWVSHGHPDHLSSHSLDLLHSKKILLPDHAGGRIPNSLRERGFDVHVLQDRVWTKLSDRLRVLCIADYNQDAVLLIDIDGSLVVDLNDAGDRGWGSFVKNTIKRYESSFLLKLTGYGDSDMINLYDESGAFILPLAARKSPLGPKIAQMTEQFGAKYFIPFSSMHKYQRKDSLWASQYTTGLSDYGVGFNSQKCEMLPAFIRYDCARHTVQKINPAENEIIPREGKFHVPDNSSLNLCSSPLKVEVQCQPQKRRN